MLRSFGGVALAVLALSACTFQGGDIGDALQRKAYWFSYVDGDDIREHCAPGTPDRFRLVYNAVWDRQVRMYDLDGIRRVLVARATRPSAMARFSLSDPLGPWQAAESRVQLDQPRYDALTAAFAASGMFGAPPVGLDLPSRSYYWTAAYCRGGRYGFTAWAYPSDRFAALTFPSPLFALDQTGVAVAPPAPVAVDPVWEAENRQGKVTNFTLKVGGSGLIR